MSLGVVVKGPEGVVLAADSRVTLEAVAPDGMRLPVNFDNATKLLVFSTQPHVGAVTYGAAVVGLRTANSLLPEFEVDLNQPEGRLNTEEFSKRLSAFFSERWKEATPDPYSGPPMTFIVGGYDEGAAYGRVFLFHIPNAPTPVEQNPGEHNFGMTWGGQLEVVTRIIHGFDPSLPALLQAQLGLDPTQIEQAFGAVKQRVALQIPYNVLPLQDCVDLATFLIRTTIAAQRLAVTVRGVGGPVEVATITRTDGLQHVQRKTIHGEGA